MPASPFPIAAEAATKEVAASAQAPTSRASAACLLEPPPEQHPRKHGTARQMRILARRADPAGRRLGDRLEYTPTVDLWRDWKKKRAMRKRQRELQRLAKRERKGEG